MTNFTESSRIGPHNGRELELMLKGSKPLALFSAEDGMSPQDIGDLEFEPFVRSGKIIKFVHRFDDRRYELRLYCLPTEEWRAKLCILTAENMFDPDFRDLFSTDDLFRLDGTLLGYQKEDIEFFVEHSRNRQKERSKE